MFLDLTLYEQEYQDWFASNVEEIKLHLYELYKRFHSKKKQTNRRKIDLLQSLTPKIGNIVHDLLEPQIESHLIQKLRNDNDRFKTEELQNLEFERRKQQLEIEKIQQNCDFELRQIQKEKDDSALRVSDEIERERQMMKETCMLESERQNNVYCEQIRRTQERNDQLEKEMVILQNRLEQVKLETKNQINEEKLIAFENHMANNERTAAEYQEKIGSFLQRYMTSQPAIKGKEAEQGYENMLNSLFPSGEIRRLAKENHSCDLELTLHKPEIHILFEIKNYQNNVPKSQIEKFHHDLRNKKAHGIMISVESGIALRTNFQVELITIQENEDENGNPISKQIIALYLPQHQNNQESILTAVNIITSLSEWIEKLNANGEKTEKSFSLTTFQKITETIQTLQMSYFTAKQSLDKAKAVLDDQNIHQLRTLLEIDKSDMNIGAVSNRTKLHQTKLK